MNLLSYLSLLILAITLLTMVFGVIAYFLYKANEKKRKSASAPGYEELLEAQERDTIFFEEERL